KILWGFASRFYYGVSFLFQSACCSFRGTWGQVPCPGFIYKSEFGTGTVDPSPRPSILLVSVSRSILLYLLFLHLYSYILLSINHHLEQMHDLLHIGLLLHRHL